MLYADRLQDRIGYQSGATHVVKTEKLKKE